MNQKPISFEHRVLNLAVIVAALGYFVDIFDLLLFGIVRVPSLKSIGVPDDQLLPVGLSLLNHQMLGVLLGGIFWGILGDKKGRVSVLFASIFLYSVANIANAFVYSIETYALFRFIAGLGLSGELGLAITLVSEILPKEKRGYGTTLVSAFGVLGSVAAAVAAYYLNWRTCYILGGVLGLILLVLRIRLQESALFHEAKAENAPRGNFWMILRSPKRLWKFIALILVGAPVWCVVGIVISFAPEVGSAIGIVDNLSPATAILVSYVFISAGGFVCGWLSEWLQSRKKAIAIFLSFTGLHLLGLILIPGKSSVFFYSFCVLMGFGTGYWTVLMTTSAEMFGTNIRSTVATTVPNLIRGSLVPLAASFQYFKASMGIVPSLLILGVSCISMGIVASLLLPETFGRDLRFVERD